jgi:hypothetical protein
VTVVAVAPESAPHVDADVQADPFHVKVQVTPALVGSLETVAVKFCVVLIVTDGAEGLTDTVIAGTVIVAEPDFVGSAAEVAVIVTERLLAGGVAGAVYVTGFVVVLLNVPHVGEQAVAPCVSVQVTPPFEVPPTVAVNCCVCVASTVEVDGATLTDTAGTVIDPEADFVGSADDVAVMATARLLAGGVAGAV